MTAFTQHIIKKIFKADSLENISVEELQRITEEYPSFGVGQYLLSKKLLEQNAGTAFHRQSKKTALYFTNPFWLQWLFQHENDTASSTPEKQGAEIIIRENKAEEADKNHQQESTFQSANEVIIPVAVEKEIKPVKEDALVFEPYHTIDYFASQGIKFSQDENPKDKLGRQLKSFTEWLKVMKKLPQKTVETEMNEAETATIVTEAAHSVEGKEVITQAMAEVLLKQGKTAEASEIYHKLSLLNPDKSAYFAAKYENLKVH
jgi:hypothetical protein